MTITFLPQDRKDEIIDEFISNTTMKDRNGDWHEVKKVFEYLFNDENVKSMIKDSVEHKTVLYYLVKKGQPKSIIQLFDEDSDFPLVWTGKVGKKEFMRNKQNVGRLIKKVMSYYGYEPDINGVKVEIEGNIHSFKTCSVYKKKE